MNITKEQLEAAEHGNAVEIDENGKRFVLLSGEIFDRVRKLLWQIPSRPTAGMRREWRNTTITTSIDDEQGRCDHHVYSPRRFSRRVETSWSCCAVGHQ